MLFSIVTVIRNNQTGLAKTASSTQVQNCTDFEWIIIDGASTDGTNEDIKNYNAIIISEPDKGIYDAMNKGIEIAKGDYIIFLNAGDALAEEETLEKIKTATLQNQPDLIYGDSWEQVESILHYKPSRPHNCILTGMFTHHQAMIYKRGIIQELRYNLKYNIAADYDFTIRFLKMAKNCLYLREPICIFASGGVSQQNAKMGRNEQFIIRQDNLIVSRVRNIATYAAQFLNWQIRSLIPTFYWKLTLLWRCWRRPNI